MRCFFDTSVLVAASERSHPHDERAWPALQEVARGEREGFMSAHSIAEVSAALTRLPTKSTLTFKTVPFAGWYQEESYVFPPECSEEGVAGFGVNASTSMPQSSGQESMRARRDAG